MEMPMWNRELSSITSCPRTGLGHFSLQEHVRASLPSTFVPGPTSHLPAPQQQVQGSFRKPKRQETPCSPTSSNKPVGSSIPEEKHNSSKDAWASKFTRVQKSGAHIRASYKGDAKQPPRSILVTSRSTGAAFHAAASRGNLIHFLIRHRLFPSAMLPNGSVGGGAEEICSLLYSKTQPLEGFTRRDEHCWKRGLWFSTGFAIGKPGAGS